MICRLCCSATVSQDTVVVGQPIAIIETGDFGGEQAAPAEPKPAEGKEDKKPAAKAEGAGAQKQQPQQKSQPFEEQKKGPENVAPPHVPSVVSGRAHCDCAFVGGALQIHQHSSSSRCCTTTITSSIDSSFWK